MFTSLNLSHVIHHLSPVMHHLSHVMRHLSHFTFHMSKFYLINFFGQSGETSWLRVCYSIVEQDNIQMETCHFDPKEDKFIAQKQEGIFKNIEICVSVENSSNGLIFRTNGRKTGTFLAKKKRAKNKQDLIFFETGFFKFCFFLLP